MNSILKKYFKYDNLKDKQEEIINNIIEGRDTIGILATGYGKSICYQLPFLLTKKTVIVISPLLSLMEDQLNKLKSLKISVYCLNSNNLDKNSDKDKILEGKCGIVYMSPEYFLKCEYFIKKLSDKDLISLIAIDESHCISTWSDFRPEYKKLGVIKKWVKNVPLLSLTATATPRTIEDIKEVLLLNDPKIIKSSFHRENLNININRKLDKQNDFNEIVDLIKKLGTDDKVIIYCKTKDDTDDFVLKFKEVDIIQKKFSEGKVKIMIATIAFGMGVDLPNIRLIINYGVSKDMESFYQEIGRAGRDGLKSDIYLYWSPGDFNINKIFLNNMRDNDLKKKQMKKILEMERFVNHKGCRMSYITNYFGEIIEKCNHCDYCLSNNEEMKVDITRECYYVLKTVKKLKYNYGTSMLCDILFGSDSKKISEDLRGISTFGLLKDIKKDRIKEIIRYLIINNYLLEEKLDNSFGSVIKLNNRGLEFVKQKLDNINDKLYEIIYKVKESKNNLEVNNVNLEKRLIEYRKEKALEENCKLYQIFPNKTIEILLNININNINDLKKVHGLGDKRIEKYGDDIIKIKKDNPLDDTKEQEILDKLVKVGLTLDDISFLKTKIII
jgi:ATP-dependent DNA helicase RecQ